MTVLLNLIASILIVLMGLPLIAFMFILAFDAMPYTMATLILSAIAFIFSNSGSVATLVPFVFLVEMLAYFFLKRNFLFSAITAISCFLVFVVFSFLNF